MVAEPEMVDAVQRNIPLALLLSTLAGLSTGLGGILMVLQNDLDFRRLGLWEGCAAGFMLAVCFLDLVPEIIHDSSTEWDLVLAGIWFLAGGLSFLVLKYFVPEPDFEAFLHPRLSSSDPQVEDSGSAAVVLHAKEVRSRDTREYKEVLWSGFTVALALALHNFPVCGHPLPVLLEV